MNIFNEFYKYLENFRNNVMTRNDPPFDLERGSIPSESVKIRSLKFVLKLKLSTLSNVYEDIFTGKYVQFACIPITILRNRIAFSISQQSMYA